MNSESSPPPNLATQVDGYLIGGLISARWFLPVESAAQGDTLLLVLITALEAALLAWRGVRHRAACNAVSSIDLMTYGLVAAHLVSAAVVLLTEGQMRLALNLAWEWYGIGLTFWLVFSATQRSNLLDPLWRSAIVAAVLLSGLGVWQNVVVYPELRGLLREYEDLSARAEQLTSAEQRRYREIQRSVPSSYLQGDAGSRALFLQRVQASQEPIGLFALANSFAGFLLVGASLLTGLWISSYQRGGTRLEKWALGLGLILIGVCLLLTKSRTAWAGAAGGTAIWFLVSIRTGAIRIRPRSVIVATLVLAVVVSVVVFSGRLDLETFAEAPKSLRYRLEYWQATLRMLIQHPLLGIGLGNFRGQYLRYKLPQSSEEIADPHNFFLDVWANAGIGGLLMLIGVIVIVAISFSKLLNVRARSASLANPAATTWWSALMIGQFGLLLAALVTWVGGGHPWESLGWILIAWWPIGTLILRWSKASIPRSPALWMVCVDDTPAGSRGD